MKKIMYLTLLLVGFLFLFLTGCSKDDNYNKTETFASLSNVAFPEEQEAKVIISQDMVKKINSSYFKIATKLFKEGKNEIFSPTSLYISLSMLAEGCVDNSYQELMNYLECSDLETLRVLNKQVFENNYYDNKDGKLKLANSFWIKHNLDVKREYIETLQKDYYGEIFQVDFSNKLDRDNIIKWINNRTDNFLNLNRDNFSIDENIEALLINTLYFNNKWQQEFKKSATYQDAFLGIDKKVNYMVHSVSSIYKETDNYIASIDYFENGNKICYLLPNEGESVYDYLQENILDFSLYEEAIVSFNVPKIIYESDYNLQETLEKVGVREIFKKGLDKINPNLFVSSIKQKAKIEFSEEGVKAAAVTSIDAPTSAEPSKNITITLNRPFI